LFVVLSDRSITPRREGSAGLSLATKNPPSRWCSGRSRSRPFSRRRGTPPTAAPGSHWDGAARDAPRSSRALAVDLSRCPAAPGTATPPAARRRDLPLTVIQCRRALGLGSRLLPPGSAPGSWRLPAAAACSQTAAAKLLGSGASTVSRLASHPLLLGKGTSLPVVENCRRRGRYTLTSA
jgi:hypothetical protein